MQALPTLSIIPAWWTAKMASLPFEEAARAHAADRGSGFSLGAGRPMLGTALFIGSQRTRRRDLRPRWASPAHAATERARGGTCGVAREARDTLDPREAIL
jgi:hypothetical protein